MLTKEKNIMLSQSIHSSSKIHDQLLKFMDTSVYPNELIWDELINNGDTAQLLGLLESLKKDARALGLWNLFLPKNYGAISPGLSNFEYASLAKIMGRVYWAPEVFNCNAPDTGNMEVLAKYGSEEQKKLWLDPLLKGKIRSAFAMTEPNVASSDATNIATSFTRSRKSLIVNGEKWFVSGACNNNCKFFIVMCVGENSHENQHQRHSMILVPRESSGIKILRDMNVFGYDDLPGGHAHVVFENVEVPEENIILGEGRGFEIAQGRLGPGRIHHCMRLIGLAQRALEIMCKRAESRVAFGKKLSEQQSVREHIAESLCEIEQARLLTLDAARIIDQYGSSAAKDSIAMIKIVAPSMACRVIDRAIQTHGAAGLSQDTFLARAYSLARSVKLADGPDQVHMMQLGRNTARKLAQLQ